MDSDALPIFFGILGGLALLFCVGAVATAVAAIRLAAAPKNGVPVGRWRRLLLAGLLCLIGVPIIYFFVAEI